MVFVCLVSPCLRSVFSACPLAWLSALWAQGEFVWMLVFDAFLIMGLWIKGFWLKGFLLRKHAKRFLRLSPCLVEGFYDVSFTFFDALADEIFFVPLFCSAIFVLLALLCKEIVHRKALLFLFCW